jgi:hypothetical protein
MALPFAGNTAFSAITFNVGDAMSLPFAAIVYGCLDLGAGLCMLLYSQ